MIFCSVVPVVYSHELLVYKVGSLVEVSAPLAAAGEDLLPEDNQLMPPSATGEIPLLED